MAMKPTPKPGPNSGKDPVRKTLKFIFGDKPRGQRTGPKQTGPAGPKKKSPSKATPKGKKPSPSDKTNYGPLPKNPTLNDYLMRGIRPPVKIKPGLKRPSDSDVILKGYNDKNTINKYKKGK